MALALGLEGWNRTFRQLPLVLSGLPESSGATVNIMDSRARLRR